MTTTTRETPQASSRSGARRRRDPKATRAAILEAAEGLFLDRGPAATPTSEIARRAGVTKSLIHHHFGSKEELWDEVKRRHFGQYYEGQRQMLTGPGRGGGELLRESVIAYFRFLERDPRSVRLMSWRLVEDESGDPCIGQEDELFELGIERIREAQEAGELRGDIEPMSIIKSFLAMSLHWFQSKSLLCRMLGPEADVEGLDERYLDDMVKILFEGIRPR